jgi:anti-sigma B factor antagonist
LPDASHPRAVSARELGTLTMTSARHGDTHVIALAGEFDLAQGSRLQRELARAEAGDARIVVVDLRGLGFVDTTGLHLILLAHRRLAGRLVLVRGGPQIQRVFEICGVEVLLPFVDEPPASQPSDPVAAVSSIVPTIEGRTRGRSDRLSDGAARRVSQAALAAAVRDLRSHDRSGSPR